MTSKQFWIAATPFVLASLIWLLKLLVTSFAEARVQVVVSERLEAVRAEHERGLAVLKAELERRTTEHTVRFSHLQERALEAISDIYAKLVILRTSTNRLTGLLSGQTFSGLTHEDALDAAQQALQDFISCYAPKAIYLDGETCDLLDSTFNAYKFIIIGCIGGLSNDPGWKSTVRAGEEHAQHLQERLEVAFRKAVGVTDSGQSAPPQYNELTDRVDRTGS